jgi:hypothetical protein
VNSEDVEQGNMVVVGRLVKKEVDGLRWASFFLLFFFVGYFFFSCSKTLGVKQERA